MLFLQTQVIPIGNKRQKDSNGVPLPLGKESIEGYCKAIVDLFKEQLALGDNMASNHPRGKALKSFLESLQRNEDARKRSVYSDRGLGTMLDGYTDEEMRSISKYFFANHGNSGFRNRLDFLLGHNTLTRGESRRAYQLADIFMIKALKEGPTDCWALVTIMKQGKCNQFGRIEYGAAFRNKDILICPVGALGLYLFWRFHVEGEPFPDMSRRSKWYDIHLLKGMILLS